MTHSILTTNFTLTTDFIHDLARRGDLLGVEIALSRGARPDTPDETGKRPLHEAAYFGQIEMISFLIAEGADVNAPVAPFGHTPLYFAVGAGQHKAAEALIHRGANLAVTDALLGTTLLHLAGANGDLKMCGILIAAGIDVFREDKNGLTARDASARRGHRALERALLKVMEHKARFGA